jgi:hypothetical protein
MSKLPDTTKAHDAVAQYCRRYCISPAFEMSPIYDLTAENWRTPIPFTLNQSCYFFYAEDGSLLYVGKASFGADLAGRVSRYFTTRPTFRPVHTGWSKPPRCLQTLKVHEAHEAPSLEEYLIQELRPFDNKIGNRPSDDD